MEFERIFWKNYVSFYEHVHLILECSTTNNSWGGGGGRAILSRSATDRLLKKWNYLG